MTIHPISDDVVDRLRRTLGAYARGHMYVRIERGRLLVERSGAAGTHADAIARITAYGESSFGLAFRESGRAWSPVLVVGSLDEIVAGLTASVPRLVRDHGVRVVGPHHQTFRIVTWAQPEPMGAWVAWLEFRAEDGDFAVLRTGHETSQPDLRAVEYWADGLEPIYFEGALERALRRSKS